jgi:hypothetical protein
VTEKDANKLIVAQRTGTLSVTLCSRKGSSDESDTTADRERLLNLTKLPEPPPPPPPPKPKDPPPPPRVYRMEVYQGGGKSIREFNEDQIDEAERNTQYVKPGPVVEPTSKETEPETTRTTVRKKPSPFARAAGAN